MQVSNDGQHIDFEHRKGEPMDDLISRQDAIKNAHFPMIDDAGYEVVRVDDILALPPAKPKIKCIAQIRINRDDMEDLVNKKVNEIVNNMKEPKTGAWIPISEKLPETGDSILVTYSDGEVGIVWSARPKVWGKYEKANNLIFPVAWMPLPEPYREDGGE